MISNKYFNKITIVLISLAVILCLLAMVFSVQLSEVFNGTVYNMEYSTKLFDTSEIISINISMPEDEWSKMLETASSEEYYKCDITINGTTFYKVGIRPKGNTSLSSIASDPDNNRYSFKLEFDQFVDDQTCWGLDKLVLNNGYADTTAMKEAIIYDMYKYLGADASLYNYAKISVNGEYWGIYLALEAVEESFMLRNYGSKIGNLYKPDGMNMGNRDDEEGGRPNFGGGEIPRFNGDMPNFNGNEMKREEMTETEQGKEAFDENKLPFDREQSREGFDKGGGFGGGGGANLNYTDDNLESYSTIWDGAVTDTDDDDHERVIKALKNISEGTNLETYLDVDSALKYMAVHSFAVNEDSLSGNMAHNYYLYENNGRLSILPWDYNLAFGGMNGRDASGVINDPIDTPFSGTQFFDKLLENEEYKAKYHEYYRKLVYEYVNGGRFDETYSRIRSQIDELVKTDPNAMYTYEQYVAGADMLYDTVKLRAESVKGQLDGTIPSTDTEQRENPNALIDTSSIDTDIMGEFMGGGRNGARDTEEITPPSANEETEQPAMKEFPQQEQINQNMPDQMRKENRSAVKNQDIQEETPIDFTSVIVSLGILLAAIILLCFVKRRY